MFPGLELDLMELADWNPGKMVSVVSPEWTAELSFEIVPNMKEDKLHREFCRTVRHATREVDCKHVPDAHEAMCNNSIARGDANMESQSGSSPLAQHLLTISSRLVIFDFDQTLTVFHVFRSLAGWSAGEGIFVPKPHVTTELGQMRRVGELNGSFAFPSGFALRAFGGEARVNMLRRSFDAVRNQGVALYICTRGLVGVAKTLLLDVGLLDCFVEVYGFNGGRYGETAYDEDVCAVEPTDHERRLLGTCKQNISKHKLMSQLSFQMNLRKDEVLLVDDDLEEISRAFGCCRTLWIQDATGINEEQLIMIEDMAGVGLPRSPTCLFDGDASIDWCGTLPARLPPHAF
eukprot:TRINITY_DN76597_c0_g1_i1.p1 TRINITY_DN76597_c0_g1~~TRINITY_DN76597_c0_g1_i1.p1  ORF type:complete len:347 (+),score=56.50 TRINITY_DN76597_c0_g1_i1:75-1115(+)